MKKNYLQLSIVKTLSSSFTFLTTS